MSVVEKFDASVSQAIERGALDTVKHGATIAAARKVASMFDDPEWPIVNGKLDNVSPSVFLKYCDALGLLPDVDVKAKPDVKSLGKLVSIQNRARYGKAANA